MNRDPDHDSTLLDDLVSDAVNQHAPPLTVVLAQLRNEKRRRTRCRRIYAAAAMLFAAALSAAVLTQRNAIPSLGNLAGQESPALPPSARENVEPPVSPPLERIDDPTMLRELGEQPAALATFPDGSQRLILLVSLPPREAASAD